MGIWWVWGCEEEGWKGVGGEEAGFVRDHSLHTRLSRANNVGPSFDTKYIQQQLDNIFLTDPLPSQTNNSLLVLRSCRTQNTLQSQPAGGTQALRATLR